MQQLSSSNNSQSEQSQNIDLEESDNMNQDERALFLDIKKSRSNDSFLGKLIGTTPQIQKRPLVLQMQQLCPPRHSSSGNQNTLVIPTPAHSIFKKVKKQKKHNKCDYQKNICGYITKKIIREFIGPTFQDLVQDLCKKYHCSSDQARKFYLSKIQFVTGPSHIPSLLNPQKNDTHQILGAKMAFRQFFNWFLRERYLRYLLLEGKMTDKKAYIQYKNTILFNFLQENRQQLDKLAKKLITKKNQEEKMEEQLLKIRSLSSNSRKSRNGKDKNIILTKNQF